jgi:hypothetical protein
MARPDPKPLSNAAFIGLGLGMLLGSIYLSIHVALRNDEVDCDAMNLLGDACILEQHALEQLRRWQGMAAVALGLIATGTFLFLSARQRAAKRRTRNAE